MYTNDQLAALTESHEKIRKRHEARKAKNIKESDHHDDMDEDGLRPAREEIAAYLGEINAVLFSKEYSVQQRGYEQAIMYLEKVYSILIPE